MLVVDEASMVREDLYVAARPMLTQKNGEIWLMSTPKQKEGFFYREFVEGGDGWRRVVVPATECPRFTEAQLAEERQTMGSRKYDHEPGMFDEAWFESSAGGL